VYGNGEVACHGQVLRDRVDAHSLAVDPLFVDPENGDFGFKEGRPALKQGIEPLDT
jgi:hypothetical protein